MSRDPSRRLRQRHRPPHQRATCIEARQRIGAGSGRQRLAQGVGRQARRALEQHCGEARNMGRREGGPREIAPGAVRRSAEDMRTGRHQHGAGHCARLGRNSDDFGMGGGKARLVPVGGAHQHHPAQCSHVEQALEQPVSRPGQTQVDDAHALAECMLQGLRQGEAAACRPLRVRRLGPTCAQREQPRIRRHTHHADPVVALGHDDAGHCGAVHLRPVPGAVHEVAMAHDSRC